MGTVTRTFTEYGTNASTWTVNLICNDVVASGATFDIYDALSSTAKYVNALKSLGAVSNRFNFTIGNHTGAFQWFSKGSGVNGCDPMTSGTLYQITKGSTYATTNIPTSSVFDASNSTSRTVSIEVSSTKIYLRSASSNWNYDNSCNDNTTISWGSAATVTLDVPPTATVSSMTYDKPYVYAGLTTASVTISDAAAYYGGSVTDVTLRIGAQTASISGNGTISLLLDTAGTFTPTVTVTDSRGQTKTYTLSQITVNSYSAPTISFTAERTDSTGKPDEEGTYATATSMLIFADAIATAIAPSVVLTDENGTQSTPTVTWYTTRASDGTLSGAVNWSNVSAGDTVYGLIPGLNTNYSYQVSIRPRDSQGTGTAITQTVASAFYTIDFLAGGHGIAFGQPSSQPGFECNMPTIFHDTVDVEDTLTAQDMTAQEVQDFIDSLNVGGGGVAVDLVIEQGTDGIWTYRKWSSGIAECWGESADVTIATSGWAAWGNVFEAAITSTSTYYPTNLFIALPKLFMTPLPVSGGALLLEIGSGATKDYAPRIWGTRGTKPSTSIVAKVQFYAVGRWK